MAPRPRATAAAIALHRPAGGAGRTAASLARPGGFRGACGLFRIRFGAPADRALAVLEPALGGAATIDAPGAER